MTEKEFVRGLGKTIQTHLEKQEENPAVLVIDKSWIMSDLEDRESCLLKEYKVKEDVLLDLLYDEIIEHIAIFLSERYERVEDRIGRKMRNYGAEKLNPHYRVEWKNEDASQTEFSTTGIFKSVKDAEEEINDYEVITGSDCYRIIKVENGEKVEIERSAENYAL